MITIHTEGNATTIQGGKTFQFLKLLLSAVFLILALVFLIQTPRDYTAIIFLVVFSVITFVSLFFDKPLEAEKIILDNSAKKLLYYKKNILQESIPLARVRIITEENLYIGIHDVSKTIFRFHFSNYLISLFIEYPDAQNQPKRLPICIRQNYTATIKLIRHFNALHEKHVLQLDEVGIIFAKTKIQSILALVCFLSHIAMAFLFLVVFAFLVILQYSITIIVGDNVQLGYFIIIPFLLCGPFVEIVFPAKFMAWYEKRKRKKTGNVSLWYLYTNIIYPRYRQKNNQFDYTPHFTKLGIMSKAAFSGTSDLELEAYNYYYNYYYHRY